MSSKVSIQVLFNLNLGYCECGTSHSFGQDLDWERLPMR